MSDLQTTLDFMMRALADAPVRTRISAYRTAAEWCGNEEESIALRTLAQDLETADRRHRELALTFAAGIPPAPTGPDFRRRHSAGGKNERLT